MLIFFASNQRNVQLLCDGLSHLGVQTLTHLNASGCDGDSAVTLVDADVAVEGEGEVVDAVLGRDKSHTTLSPHVILFFVN
jgi:hypothetical protein